MPVKLIAHTLIEKDGKYLLIKRSKIKRGSPNMYPEYWDIPGGSVEEDELPREGAVRETMEEVIMASLPNKELNRLIKIEIAVENLIENGVLDEGVFNQYLKEV